MAIISRGNNLHFQIGYVAIPIAGNLSIGDLVFLGTSCSSFPLHKIKNTITQSLKEKEILNQKY